ncbi:hypothetical protein [Aminipila terrae]|uniref:hypothetical protein n=1 Tax=Aminipila terrae TaxID=2697030 RepID=UPI00192FAFD4|nr:hypothetical protein [Aminipila terrae]
MLLKALGIFVFCIAIGYGVLPTCWYKSQQKMERIRTKEKKLYLTFDDGPIVNLQENFWIYWINIR